MQIDDLVKVVAALPEARAVVKDDAYWSNVVPSVVNLVVDEILVAHDWDFVIKQYSSEVSVADQGDYTIRGDSEFDCRDIVAVWYSSDEDLLARYREADMDDILSNDQAPSDVFGWTQSRRSDDGYPIITLHSTPGTAGEQIKIRYRKNSVTLASFPDSLGHVVALGALAWLLPRNRPLFERELKRMIRRYNRGGKDIQRTPISPRASRANNDIASSYGRG